MKYIKSFNESIEFLTYTQFMEDIKDILLPISDLGYDIDVNMVKDDDTNRIYVRVVSYGDPFLVWNKDIEEEFNRLREFSLENGFKLSKVYYITEDSSGNRSDRIIIPYESFLEVKEKKPIINLLFELEQITR